MNILHIINSLSMGGAENMLASLIGVQQKEGNQVTVLTLKLSECEVITEKICAEGCLVKTLMKRGALYNPLLILKVMPWIKKYDIVHVHLFPSLYWVGLAKLISFCKTPIVYTEHSTKNKRRTNPVFNCIDAFIYKYCYNKVVACSDKALETFVRFYPRVRHVCAINNGIDIEKYCTAAPYTKQKLLGIPEDSFVVTMVARFMFMKRQDTVVEAISTLPEKFHACFVGSNANDEGLLKVKKLAKDLGVSNRVHFLYIRSDVPRILKTSDAVIMSSEYEGLSLSSLEGMAAGKPFIATNADGLREIVNGAGELFQVGDCQRLAEILLYLASDKQYYEKKVLACRKRAAEYDIQKTVRKYIGLYSELV